MGMYTELCISVELKETVSQHVVNTIKWLAGDRECEQAELPTHPAFKAGNRISAVLTSSSYYFAACKSRTEFYYDDITNSWRLDARSNLKDYNDEIALFMEWLGPYIEPRDVDDDGWQFVGHMRYEEDMYPTIIYVHEDGRVQYDSVKRKVESVRAG